MRGKKAKRIRKSVYGNMSHRQRRYIRDPKIGGRVNTGARWAYQSAKTLTKELGL